MWTTEHTVVTTASRQAVWQVWTDVEHWSDWDDGVESAHVDGAFEVGGTYTLKPAGGPKVKARFTKVEPLSGFTNISSLPLAKMEFAHTLAEQPDGLHVTHRLTITGPLSFVFARVIGKDTERGLPSAMAKLAKIAEGASS